MLRIWSESLISAVSEDAEFLGVLASQVDSKFNLKVFDAESVRGGALNNCDHALILWDLTTLPIEDLQSYLKTNPNILGTCSVLIVCDDQTIDMAGQVLHSGAIDFVRKPAHANELRERLRLARRPWVRAMRTTFDFLGSMNVEFTTMEQKILLCFLASPDFAASRASINAELWNSSAVNSNSLDVHLFNIRRKIEPTGLEIRFNNKRGSWVLTSKKMPSHSAQERLSGGENESKG